jgi:hypothetical protein
MKNMLTELHGGSSGGHLGVNKTLNKVRQRYYWLQARGDIERWCPMCDICAANRGPRTRNWGQMHQYNVGCAVREDNHQCSRSISTERPRKPIPPESHRLFYEVAYAIPNQEASKVAEALVTNFFYHLGIPQELHSDQGRNFKSRLLQEVLQLL